MKDFGGIFSDLSIIFKDIELVQNIFWLVQAFCWHTTVILYKKIHEFSTLHYATSTDHLDIRHLYIVITTFCNNYSYSNTVTTRHL